MVSLAAKYTKLKKSIGGNREKTGYEESFGQPFDECYNVTPPSKWQIRILSEIEFSIRLSGINNKFDEIIDKAIDYLQNCIDESGAVTNKDCEEAEAMLMELAPAAKEYNLILAAHAHIDMNWMWGWQETVAATLATFRTMLKLMDEYPEFCFSQSQASVYKIVEDYDPEMMESIKRRIREGRWEVTASAWVETDKNMPNTESLLNHIKYTKDYLTEKWDIDPDKLEIDFSPDTFGHSANIPEINSYGNVKYYYHCRGTDGNDVLYRWKAPSGKEVLVYREQYWYNSGITPFAGIGLIDISQRCAGLKTGLIVYGVGDHGGGPTRRDIEKAIEMNKWPVFPSFKFGTMIEFFKIAERVRDELPVLNKELNFFAPGCYTTQSRIKLGNRKCEAALNDAQGWSAFASKYTGFKYQFRQFERAWQNVLFTHFHDILTGSCVQETREHAMGLYSDSMSAAHTQMSNAIRVMAENIDTSSIVCDDDISGSRAEGAGAGYGLSSYSGIKQEEQGAGVKRIFHLFNPGGHERCEPVELTVWDWPGDMRHIKVTGWNGEDLEFQLLDSKKQGYWSHEYFRILVYAKVPVFGYTTVILEQADCGEYKLYYQREVRTSKPSTDYILENEWLRAEFSYKSGELVSYIDKASDKEWIKQGESAGLRYQETERGTSNAWHIGNYTSSEHKLTLVNMKRKESGGLRTGVEIEYKIKSSVVRLKITLDKNSKCLKYSINADWHEVSRDKEPVPVLLFSVPLNEEIPGYLYDVPAGAQYREPMDMDAPGLQYGAAVSKSCGDENESKAFAVISDCKYGYRGVDNQLICTLINSTIGPDPYPERGVHDINLAVGAAEACPVKLENLAYDVNHIISYQSSTPHKGTLPLETYLFNFEAESAVLSSVTLSDAGNLMIRTYEVLGKTDNVTISLNKAVKSAFAVNLDGRANGGPVSIKGDKVIFEVKPYSIQAVEVEV